MTEAKASDNLVERLRAVAPLRKEGQSNDFALFDMANVNLQDLNALINEAATRIEKLQAALLEAGEALKPFAGHVGKSGECVTLIIGKDTWTASLTTDDFKRASDVCRRIRLINTHDGRDA
jgi:hypothetical protein